VNLPTFRRHKGHPAPTPSPAVPGAEQIGTAQLQELATVFGAPRWLRDLGRTSWLLVGLFALIAGLIWLLGATHTIVGPVVAASIVATVAMPIVAVLARHMPRAAAAAIVLLGLVAIALLVVVLVIAGLVGQRDEISSTASAAADKAQSWLKSVGVDESGAASAKSKVNAEVPNIISTLATGVISGIRGLVSLAFALSFAALSLFFLLKDGPLMRRWVDRHLGVSESVARTITGGLIRSLRGYFRGVTIVAAFNGVVVTLGALVLDVPLAGTIGIVSFVTAYVPYIGAFVAGAFAVIIALGAKGTVTALLMLLIVLLANGLLQNIFQPFAMGAALQLNPLVVLVVTIAAGCVFGTIGLILAAPLLSAAVHVTQDLGRARLVAGMGAKTPPEQTAPHVPEPTSG
jgi:predicted PurR-regulated permease PerM